MQQIARLDSNNILVSVDTPTTETECKTCHVAKTVKLPKNHDMHNKLGQYSFCFEKGSFEPVEEEEDKLEKVIRSKSTFASAVVDVLQLITDKLEIDIPEKTRKNLGI